MTPIQLQEIEPKEIIPGYTARMVHAENMTLAYWTIEANAPLPEHSHPHEQVATVISGEFELVVEGETFHLTPGQVKIIPGGAVHSGIARTACELLDIFHPVREEYR